ncbi:MAG: iviTM7 [Candidatus Saccharibacteria bacterium]|nr:iviTM7 [Candidatus Saccharibacteria bacterium]
MPRRKKDIKYIPPKPHDPEAGKKRYPTKKMAETAAETQMLQIPGLELTVYQTENGGWYLTRRIKDK